MPQDKPPAPTQEEVRAEFADLIHSARVGVLITMTAEGPFGSHVPFLVGPDWTKVYIHISQLAIHTKNLAHDRHIALFVAEPDRQEKNPLSLRRINLQGEARPLAPKSPDYADMQVRYVERFPQSAMMFQFADFQLWALEMTSAHFVAGFGRAFLAKHHAPLDWTHQGA